MLEIFLNKLTDNGNLKCEFNYACKSMDGMKSDSYEKILEMFPNKENLYFVNGIKDINANRSKSNIEYVNRFTIDIDLRKNVKVWKDLDITDEEIIEEAKLLGEHLKVERPKDFGQWSYIIFTGNGIHIHYFGKPLKVEGEDFAIVFQETLVDIYNEFTDYMGDPYEADPKVGDLGHLFRLPGTWNIKEGKKHKCEIVSFQEIESDIVNNLSILMEYTIKKNNIKNIKEQKRMQNRKQNKTLRENDNVWEYIRKEVDVGVLMTHFVPERPLKKDNKNFTKKGKSGNNSYFIDRENNIIIRNGSTFLAGDKEGMNSIDLVQAYTGLTGKKILDWLVYNKFISIKE